MKHITKQHGKLSLIWLLRCHTAASHISLLLLLLLLLLLPADACLSCCGCFYCSCHFRSRSSSCCSPAQWLICNNQETACVLRQHRVSIIRASALFYPLIKRATLSSILACFPPTAPITALGCPSLYCHTASPSQASALALHSNTQSALVARKK